MYPRTSHRLHLVAVTTAALCLLPSVTLAKGKGMRECKPSGPPAALAVEGAHEALQILEARGKTWLFTVDDRKKPTKLKLLSNDGEALELSRPQATTVPTNFVARGQGTIAIGTMRSMTNGKDDVVLIRWGTDPRPRVTLLSTSIPIDGPPVGALVNEYFTGVWVQPAADGKPHVMAVSVDLEELKPSPIVDLGGFVPGGFLRAVAVDKSVIVVWTAPEGTQRAVLDSRAKVTTKAATLARKDTGKLRGLQQCGDKLWLLSDVNDKAIAASTVDGAGAVTQVVTIAATPSSETLSMSCVDTGVVVAHPTFTEKSGNIVLWVSAIDANGKVRDRRVKDETGTADGAHSALFPSAKDPAGLWWVEGRGAQAQMVYRPLSCE